MNEVKWKLHYRCRDTGIGGPSSRPSGDRNHIQSVIDEWSKFYPHTDYWMVPEFVEPAEPPKPSERQTIHWHDPLTGKSGATDVTRLEMIHHGAIWKAAKDCGIEFLTDEEKREKDQKWRIWETTVRGGNRRKTSWVGELDEMTDRATDFTRSAIGREVYTVEREEVA